VAKQDNCEAYAQRETVSLKTLGMVTAGLLLFGGVLLDANRIIGVRETLDKVARSAASEAIAATRPVERQRICERRLNKQIWTDTEVSLEDVDITIADDTKIKTATVSYDVSVNLVVGRFFGFNEVVISGEVEAEGPSNMTMPSLP
jgi:hypothetical protein